MSRKRHPVWKTLLLMAADGLAVGAALYGAYWLRFYSRIIPVTQGFDPTHYLKMLPYAWALWVVALRFENLYRRRMRVLDFSVVRRIVSGSVLALLAVLALNFFFRFPAPPGEYSRLVPVIMFVLVIAALIANRIVLYMVFKTLTRHGIGQSRTVVLGNGPLAEYVCRTIERHPEFGMKVLGVILGKPQSGPPALSPDIPVLGAAHHLDALLIEHRADEVILAQPELDRELIPTLLIQCERAMAEFRIVPETTELLLSGMTAETLDGIPLLGIRETPLQGWNAALKRVVDFIVAFAGLVVTSPLLVYLAWRVRRQDGHPAFYLQERMGIDGRHFQIIKLRTMRPDAEEERGPTFASDYDPRCTPLGMLLRRTHLDELPQLVNVLRGDMSLVGPRPERPYFVERFRDNVPRYMARHKVKSGITGWAQVNGLCGPHGSIDQRLKYDLYYIENWSLSLDMKIIFLTLFGRIKPGPGE